MYIYIYICTYFEGVKYPKTQAASQEIEDDTHKSRRANTGAKISL